MVAKHNLLGAGAHYGGTLTLALPPLGAARPAGRTRSRPPILVAADAGFPPASLHCRHSRPSGIPPATGETGREIRQIESGRRAAGKGSPGPSVWCILGP